MSRAGSTPSDQVLRDRPAHAAAGPARRGMSEFKLLLVEDNPRDARLAEIGLNEVSGLVSSLWHAPDLSTAIELAQQHKPEVALLDLGLPDANGLETLERFTAAAPDVAVVVLTHLAEDDVAEAALACGAQDFVVKGRLQGEMLRRILRFAVERHDLVTRLARSGS